MYTVHDLGCQINKVYGLIQLEQKNVIYNAVHTTVKNFCNLQAWPIMVRPMTRQMKAKEPLPLPNKVKVQYLTTNTVLHCFGLVNTLYCKARATPSIKIYAKMYPAKQ